MHPDSSDQALVLAARRGDREAFAALLARHRGLLVGVCRRLLGRADGLEDVLQEAALQALLGLDRLQQPERFGPWLAGIGLHTVQRWLRRERADDAWSWAALLGGQPVRDPLDEAPGPEEMAESAELAAAVRRCCWCTCPA